MNSTERRKTNREFSGPEINPLSCSLVNNFENTPLKIINYHYSGGCFELPENKKLELAPDSHLIFKLGFKDLSEKIQFEVIWDTTSANGMFGVKFLTESTYQLSRPSRFSANAINIPTVSSADPLDPNRMIYFRVLNASTSGLLLSTSLSNKHLFPGMEMKDAEMTIPSIGTAKIDLFIENSRPGKDDTISFGTSIKSSGQDYQKIISKYLSQLGSFENVENRISALSSSGLLAKELKGGLSIRQVTDESDYVQVLQLRYQGYLKAKKISEKATFRDMGEGINSEGIVLAAFLGGQIIASVELRFSKYISLRLHQKFDFAINTYLSTNEFVEINKLVVSPEAQKSDVVVGMFQKIHALTIMNGKPDGLLIAEDGLVHLYKRLGAKKVGLSYPHPTKENTNLHVMCIPRETYEQAQGINPLAWSHVYKGTQKYFSDAGLARPKFFSFREKFLMKISGLALRISKFYKKTKNSSKKEIDSRVNAIEYKSENSSYSAIDPKWTSQHLHASVFLPYLLVSEKLIGKDKTQNILIKFNFSRDYFQSQGNWISIRFFNEFIERYKEFASVSELQVKAGYQTFSSEVLGVNHFLLKHFLTPQEAFKAMATYLPKFNTTRTYEVLESSSTSCKVRIGIKDRNLMPKDPSAALNWTAVLDGHVLAITGKPGIVEQSKSIFNGDEFCEYTIRWSNPTINTRTFIAFLLILGLGLSTFKWLSTFLTLTIISILFALATSISLTLYLTILSRRRLYSYTGVVESLSQFQKDADNRYRELQISKSLIEKSYQEGRILADLSRDIQRSEDLNLILNNSLESLCTKFEFQRAFIMTVDESNNFLRTVAMFGAADVSEKLWAFKVNISKKRVNPMVLSSVYHSGQSILISNIEDHKFHLNESSRQLLENLQTSGFAIVPIPSNQKNWGVLVADKGKTNDEIARRDLVTLQRLAQSIGMALDKKAKLESEIQVRRAFQKYVPSVVVDSTLGKKEPTLGGQTRIAVCLFMDIRNFTALSQQLPAEILCEIINEIFNLLQKNIKVSNGVIDKFLGDGALVTWGAIPGSDCPSERILDNTFNFLNDVAKFNEVIKQRGLAALEVGIGIHKGSVIAGNIGSQERMEFTVIGNTVNIASRLEQLTKVYKSQIVISEALIDFNTLDRTWTVHDSVQIRGMDGLMKIATFSRNAINIKNEKNSA